MEWRSRPLAGTQLDWLPPVLSLVCGRTPAGRYRQNEPWRVRSGSPPFDHGSIRGSGGIVIAAFFSNGTLSCKRVHLKLSSHIVSQYRGHVSNSQCVVLWTFQASAARPKPQSRIVFQLLSVENCKNKPGHFAIVNASSYRTSKGDSLINSVVDNLKEAKLFSRVSSNYSCERWRLPDVHSMAYVLSWERYEIPLIGNRLRNFQQFHSWKAKSFLYTYPYNWIWSLVCLNVLNFSKHH